MLELNNLYNMDCMDGMRQFPDRYFDLAIVDPPYGINVTGTPGGAIKNSSRSAARIGGAKPFGTNRKGVILPKHITLSMIQKFQMQNISRSLKECQKTA